MSKGKETDHESLKNLESKLKLRCNMGAVLQTLSLKRMH